MSFRPALLAAALLAGPLLAASAAPALAQQMPLKSDAQKRGAQPSAPERAPAALPGAVSGPSTQRAVLGLKPNEALFDAVNRGDIAAAREALSRGADVDSRNVLGLTPVQLAVDLGRNDITFLLLSMRGTGSARGAAPPPPAGRPAAAPVRMAAAPAPRPAPAAAPRAITPVSAPVPGRDPGVPAPQAGFLGFGGSH